MSHDERLTDTWRRGSPSLGVWCEIPSPFSAEVVARCGFDWACVDWQHGFTGVEATTAILAAVAGHGTAPLVRVSGSDSAEIGRALDIGAHGVIVPMVETADQAAAAVAACRYPPVGDRSIGPARVSTSIGVDPAQVNHRIACVVMIETPVGLAHAEEIVGVPGIDAIFLGPGDMQLRLGNRAVDPLPTAIVSTLAATCRSAEVPVGAYAGSAEAAAAYIAAGYTMIAVSSDRELLADASRSALAAIAPSRARPHVDAIVPVNAHDFVDEIE